MVLENWVESVPLSTGALADCCARAELAQHSASMDESATKRARDAVTWCRHLVRPFRQWVTGLALGVAALGLHAEGSASKPVQLVVPYPAGGVADFVARLIQPTYQKKLGQPVSVENVSGVGGALGLQRVLAAAPDGNTQALGAPTELVLTPLALRTVSYQPEDWRLAALIATTPLFLLVRGDMPASTVDGLIEWARGRSPSHGSAGVGSLNHIVGERFADLSGLKLTHVPYRGGNTLITDLAGGQLDMAFFPMAGPVPAMVKQGRIKALGVCQAAPSPLFPEVQALGLHPSLRGFHFDTWIGLQVPRATPDTAVARINQALGETLKSDAVRRQIEATGAEPARAMDVTELDRFYAAEIQRYRALAATVKWPPP